MTSKHRLPGNIGHHNCVQWMVVVLNFFLGKINSKRRSLMLCLMTSSSCLDQVKKIEVVLLTITGFFRTGAKEYE